VPDAAGFDRIFGVKWRDWKMLFPTSPGKRLRQNRRVASTIVRHQDRRKQDATRTIRCNWI